MIEVDLSNVHAREPFRHRAGGAGAAVAHALLSEGVQQLSIFDVEISRAQSLANNLNQHFGAGRTVAGREGLIPSPHIRPSDTAEPTRKSSRDDAL